MADTPDPNEQQPLIADEISNQQIGARVPEDVAPGLFTTGTIVTMGGHEFVLDFLLRMGRPHMLAARVILPPGVAALAANLLQKGISSYEGRFGKIGGQTQQQPDQSQPQQQPDSPTPPDAPAAPPASTPPQQSPASSAAMPPPPPPDDAPPATPAQPSVEEPIIAGPNQPPAPAPPQPPTPPRVENRPGSLRDTYDDLKVTDNLVTGAYANAIMVSHNDAVFQLDFIANFPPYAMVVKRFFLPINQAPRLADALKITLQRFAQNQQKLRQTRRQQPPPQPPEAEG